MRYAQPASTAHPAISVIDPVSTVSYSTGTCEGERLRRSLLFLDSVRVYCVSGNRMEQQAAAVMAAEGQLNREIY